MATPQEAERELMVNDDGECDGPDEENEPLNYEKAVNLGSGSGSVRTLGARSNLQLDRGRRAAAASGAAWMTQKGLEKADAPNCRVNSALVADRYRIATEAGRTAIEVRLKDGSETHED